jgi:competence protein ComEC
MPLLWLSLAFLSGILAAGFLRLPLPAWLAISLACLGLIPARRLASRWLARRGRLGFALRLPFHIPLPIPLLLAAAALGGARLQAARPALEPGFIAWYNDPPAVWIVEGVLIAPPDRREAYTQVRLQVERLRPLDDLLFQPVDGLLLARLFEPGDWRYGDRLRLEGRLEAPPQWEGSSYRDVLARQGIHSWMPSPSVQVIGRGQANPFLAAVFGLRQRLLEVVYRQWPDPEASLLAGILLGVESGIPEGVRQAFEDTGTSHIIAISGFNIAIIAGLFSRLFSRLLDPRRAALAALAAISLYTVLVGAQPPVVRAAVMGGLSLFASQVGRRQDGLNSLALVAAGMALFDPFVLWDVGFQLSFAATLGLVLYADPLSAAFTRLAARFLPLDSAQRLAGPVGEYLLFTLAAQLTTLPVILYHFQRLSLSALLANPAALPAQPPLMLFGGAALLAGLAFEPAGRILAALAWPFVAYTIRIVELLARLPGGVLVTGELSSLAAAGMYAALLGLTAAWGPLQAWLARRQAPPLPAWKPAALGGVGILAILAWQAAFAAPDGRLHLTVLPVSAAGRSGDGLLIETPGGRFVLIDGGPSATRLSDALGRRLPAIPRRLDALLIANPSAENLASLEQTLERFPPGWVLWAGPTFASPEARRLQARLSGLGIPVTAAQPGQAIDLGDGARLRVLTAGRRGAALLLEYGHFRLLLPLGPDAEDLAALQADASLIHPDALLLAESGYAPANPPEWLAALAPRLALLSVAADDRAGLPSPETLEALGGYPLLRTDRNGWIEVTTDGEQMWVEVERP